MAGERRIDPISWTGLMKERYEALGFPPYQWSVYDDAPLTPLTRPLAQCAVTMLTSGGVSLKAAPGFDPYARNDFRVDAFEQTRQHLFRDLVDAGLEALRLFGLGHFGGRALVQPLHRLFFGRQVQRERWRFGGRRVEGRELRSPAEAGASLHRLGHAEGGAASGTGSASECAHHIILF